MQKRMGRRAVVRLASYTLALIIALAVAAISGYTLANRNRTVIEYGYQRALGELTEYIGNLDITLEKGKYAATEKQLTGLSAKLQRDAGYAKNALEQLPVSAQELSNTYRFLSQVGNFCVSLSGRVAQGETLTEEETAALAQLSGYARTLTGQLAAMQSSLEAGELRLGEVAQVMRQEGETGAPPDINSGFLELEQGFEDYPTLIYDGPFSDHIQQQEPKLLKDKALIEEAEAIRKATSFGDVGHLTGSGELGGNLPCFQFAGETVAVSVTKAGGYVSSYIDSRVIGEASLTVEQAVKKGEDFLVLKDYTGFVVRYYSLNNGVLTINFAYAPDGVVYYPDLIKVGIAMDNGDMVLFDAKGYIMNHTARDLPAAKLSLKEARAKLSPRLTPQGEGRLTVIPSEGLREIPCYEFQCTGDDEEQVLVYINIETGMEEQILILLKDETGVLAM